MLVRAVRAHATLPPASNTQFWDDIADECRRMDDSGEVTMTGEELAADVASEFEQARFVYPSGSKEVAVGDLGCAESRLVSAVKGASRHRPHTKRAPSADCK